MDKGITEPTRAVVIGASIAGLLAARVLSDFFDQVVVVERDQLPQTIAPRRGVPQSVQPHVLLTQGYRILEALFADIGKDLSAAGAVPFDWGREFHYFIKGGFNATVEGDSGLVSYSCTRPLLETTVRRHVAALPNVRWVEGSRVCGLLGQADKVSGVRYRPHHDGAEQQIAANLVVDGSGRSSHAPAWLQQQTMLDQPLNTTNFQQRLAKVLQFPWGVTTGSDLQFAMTEGVVPASPFGDLMQKYIDRLIQQSKQEGWVHVRFTEVAHMVKPPSAFFAPRLLARALLG